MVKTPENQNHEKHTNPNPMSNPSSSSRRRPSWRKEAQARQQEANSQRSRQSETGDAETATKAGGNSGATADAAGQNANRPMSLVEQAMCSWSPTGLWRNRFIDVR